MNLPDDRGLPARPVGANATETLLSRSTMKIQLIAAVLVAAAASVTTPAFANGDGASSGTVTRAQVRAELAQLAEAGFRPNRPNDPHYPDDIQAALRQIHASDAVADDTSASGYGGNGGAVTEGGRPNVIRSAERSIYFGH